MAAAVKQTSFPLATARFSSAGVDSISLPLILIKHRPGRGSGGPRHCRFADGSGTDWKQPVRASGLMRRERNEQEARRI